MSDKEIRKCNSNSVFKLFSLLLRFIRKLFQPKNKLVGKSWQDIKLEISPAIKRYLEMRHISEDEAKQVIYQAETTKDVDGL